MLAGTPNTRVSTPHISSAGCVVYTCYLAPQTARFDGIPFSTGSPEDGIRLVDSGAQRALEAVSMQASGTNSSLLNPPSGRSRTAGLVWLVEVELLAISADWPSLSPGNGQGLDRC